MLTWIGTQKGIECWYTIPARDLTAKEVHQYGGKKALIATGLYVKPKDEPIAPDSEEIDPGLFDDLGQGFTDDE